MTYSTLIVEIDNNVALVQFNRPEVMNALNAELLGELGQVMTELGANPKVRAIVLTGNDKVFAAGADIKEMQDNSFVDMFTKDFLTDDMDRFLKCRKPIIAAVSGYALGGGCELAMMCDFILCSETAKFGQPEINIGVMAGLGGTQRLTRIVGKSKAMEMNLTGRLMDAEEAERSGLVSRIIPTENLLAEALKTAGQIAVKSNIAAMAVKESVNRAYETPQSEGLLYERRLFHALFATEDQSEGMAAFVEKRSAQFNDK
jgi:enoyl-CoA hydratase